MKKNLYASLKAKLAQQGVNAKITPSTCRFEQKILNGTQIFEMKMLEDNGASNVTEIRIRKNDRFVASHIGLFLMNRNTATPGIEVLQTYPNPQVFPDETTNFLGKHLEVIYNSTLRFTVGQTQVLERLATKSFRAIDSLIQTSSTTASSDGDEMGFIELPTPLTISGADNTKLELVLPTTAGIKIQNTTASQDNYIVVMLKGFLIPQ